MLTLKYQFSLGSRLVSSPRPLIPIPQPADYVSDVLVLELHVLIINLNTKLRTFERAQTQHASLDVAHSSDKG